MVRPRVALKDKAELERARNHGRRRSTVLHLEFHKIEGLARC